VTGEFADEVVVFLDETGTPSLDTIDADFPIFLLALLICTPATYIDRIVPSVYRLKYRYFGHEGVVLHSHEIRKRIEAFTILNDPSVRIPFLQGISDPGQSHLNRVAQRFTTQRVVPAEIRRSSPRFLSPGRESAATVEAKGNQRRAIS